MRRTTVIKPEPDFTTEEDDAYKFKMLRHYVEDGNVSGLSLKNLMFIASNAEYFIPASPVDAERYLKKFCVTVLCEIKRRHDEVVNASKVLKEFLHK